METSEKVAQWTDSGALHTAERLVAAENNARRDFEEILRLLRTSAQPVALYEVERAVFARVLNLGRLLLESFLAAKGTGRLPDVAPVTAPAGESLPFHSTKSRRYLSVFGEIEIPRAYYWGPAAEGCFPLDAELNLPAQHYSYLLQEWGELLGADGSFAKVSERLERIFGLKFWTQGVQHVARVAAADVQAFYEASPAPVEPEPLDSGAYKPRLTTPVMRVRQNRGSRHQRTRASPSVASLSSRSLRRSGTATSSTHLHESAATSPLMQGRM